jgi:hypothetical protein
VKPGIVGFHVGLYVGKSSPPDMIRLNGINSLNPDCRECRVAIEEETCRELPNSTFQAIGISQTLHLLGLE